MHYKSVTDFISPLSTQQYMNSGRIAQEINEKQTVSIVFAEEEMIIM